MIINQIMSTCDIIRETSYEIHRYLRNGFLEKIYQNALIHRLNNQNLDIKSNYPLFVYDIDGTLLGEYIVDLYVNNSIIVEIKACKTLAPEHTAQLLGYLRASRIEHGLLINFGSSKLEIQKYILNDKTENTINNSQVK